jgi:hypothetical protein
VPTVQQNPVTPMTRRCSGAISRNDSAMANCSSAECWRSMRARRSSSCIAKRGLTLLYVENEHVMFSPTDLVDTLICARDNGLPAISKIPQLERAETTRLLDNGCVGIQLPRTESRHDLETLIGYMKLRPLALEQARRTSPMWITDRRPFTRRGCVTQTPRPSLSVILRARKVTVMPKRSSRHRAWTCSTLDHTTLASQGGIPVTTVILMCLSR